MSASTPPQPRTQSAYAGDTTQTSGLLPITASLTYPWSAGTVTLTGGIADPTISGISCIAVALPGWQCSFTLNSLNSVAVCGSFFNHYCMVNPSFAVTGSVGANAGISFAKLPDVSAVTVTSGGGTPRVMSSTAINGTLTSAGVGTVKLPGHLVLFPL